MRKVLVLAVHPDDETLGCGGTLLKHKSNGDRIYWLIATSIKEEDGFSREEAAARRAEIKTIGRSYRFDGIEELGFSTMKADRQPMQDMIAKISKVFNTIRPEIVYLPFIKDAHSDHRIFSEAAYSCTKTFRRPFVKKVLMMETISETEFAPAMKDCVFIPNYFVDISGFIDKKIGIMRTYKSEIASHPFPRSSKNIKALAVFRGATAGCKFAESFMMMRETW